MQNIAVSILSRPSPFQVLVLSSEVNGIYTDEHLSRNRHLKQLFLTRQVKEEEHYFLPTLQILLNTSALRPRIQDV